MLIWNIFIWFLSKYFSRNSGLAAPSKAVSREHNLAAVLICTVTVFMVCHTPRERYSQAWGSHWSSSDFTALSLVEMFVAMLPTPALLCHKEPAQGTQRISFLSLVLYRIRVGGFHSGKESIIILCHKDKLIQPMRAKPGYIPPRLVLNCTEVFMIDRQG